ncbi:MAG: hypothetical protein RSC33_07490, partial [Vagococcus sp.]
DEMDEYKLKKEEAQKNRVQQLKDDLEYVLNSEAGRRFIYHLLEECGVYNISHCNDIAFNEGKRSIGLMIMKEINMLDDEDAIRYEIMMKRESFARQREKEHENEEFI